MSSISPDLRPLVTRTFRSMMSLSLPLSAACQRATSSNAAPASVTVKETRCKVVDFAHLFESASRREKLSAERANIARRAKRAERCTTRTSRHAMPMRAASTCRARVDVRTRVHVDRVRAFASARPVRALCHKRCERTRTGPHLGVPSVRAGAAAPSRFELPFPP